MIGQSSYETFKALSEIQYQTLQIKQIMTRKQMINFKERNVLTTMHFKILKKVKHLSAQLTIY